MHIFFLVLSYAIIAYMLFSSLSYILLFGLAFRKVYRESELDPRETTEDIAGNERTFPVSILVPAYNEEVGVVSTVRSLLALEYPEKEIIVIDDGSKDQTSARMIEEFQMTEVSFAVRAYLETAEIKTIYQSSIFPYIRLIKKANGGKADALNAGINLASYPYFCAIDGDSVLENDALLKTMKPIIESDGQIIVTGGSVRIANGSTISRSKVETINLPSHPVVLMQIIEYFRAFLIGRLALSRMNILLIVSGAFGVFHKERVIRAGGYNRKTVGEDMELVVRLHRLLREEKSKQRIEYIPDPVCWTEAPESLEVLRSQRIRWQRGLWETLWTHRKMIFNPAYGSIGLLSMPYFLLVELLGAVFELGGYFMIFGGFFFSLIDPKTAGILFLVTIFYGSFISALAVLLEEMTLHKYPKVSHLVRLYLWALTETFWYRPFMVIWRIQGIFAAFRKKHNWGNMKRKGIST
ncbi:glycosyltransferase [Domibacillus sp. DTU_2020_1001157_1_SI_ALB_TIR_016]|uniref:glycosyltransferase family 2 protein n=1 Tax=Domibacillus sp. DTU_2020_1001157_1_SI_ALB_TIR_016 TaxID=3077789 RepID=UPI0028F0EAC4|nr:glycosyltransferase [Domibacillus sp. DTU_2020_1001157_1_SI_ALB_TIR_016]WNS81419.1 glycosyltransferase [Domibacillus sp. DTU_2020_1001157_1_SI_ALB_TIR_016]